MDTQIDTAQRRAIIGGHYYCEDPWYSCPLAEDGCTNEAIDETVCTCGYDDRVKALDAALQQARRDALEEAAKVCNERAAFYEAEEAKAGDDKQYRLTRGIQRNEASCCAHALDRLREGRE